MIYKNYFKHPSAEISPDAKLGEGCCIWGNVHIRENVKIGKNVNIGRDVYIDSDVVIGDNCKIQNSVNIFKGVIIRNKVFIGPGVVFTNDLYPRAFNKNWKISKTIVEEGASIGANATIICGVKIFKYSMVGAGSVITKNTKAFYLHYGNPAKPIKKISKILTK